MKKYLYILLLLCLMGLLLSGCAKTNADQTTSDTPETQEQKSATANVIVDVDLTALNSTMVYAEVFNMTTNPEDYLGKTIKMSGSYSTTFYDETGLYYHYVIIEDAAACCQSGLEFIWNGEHKYPDDYPAEQTKIEVVGVFGEYDEFGETFYYLAVDEISILTR